LRLSAAWQDGDIDTSRLSLELLRSLDRKRLVEACVTWFGFLRFRVETTRQGADGNVDLRLYTGVSKQAGILVQCKAQDWGEGRPYTRRRPTSRRAR